MTTSEQVNEIVSALVSARPKFQTVTKEESAKIEGRNGSSYGYKYAGLPATLEAVIPALTEAGVVVIQAPHVDEAGALGLITRLAHTSGQWMESRYPLKSFDRAQEMGSAITYARRYALNAMLSIAAEEDDDGAAATLNAPTHKEGEAWQICSEIKNVDLKPTSRAGVTKYVVTFADGTKAATISAKLGTACREATNDGEYVADLVQTQYGTDVKKIVRSQVQPIKAVPTVAGEVQPF